MKVKLISMTPDPINVMWVAAKACYASESPIDIWNKAYETYLDPDNVLTDAYEKQDKACWKLVKQVLDSGHLSIAEHVTFTFAIEGISRACSHQLVRHRHCTFSQQSQRYVEIKENQDELEDLFCGGDAEYKKLYEILNKYFVDGDKLSNVNGYYYALDNYLQAIKNGQKPEDARRFLPNATRTNIVMSCNLRQLMHICDLRLCNRAQGEIRELFRKIKEEVKKQNVEIAELLQPQCDRLGFCPEHKSCGKTPTKIDFQKEIEN